MRYITLSALLLLAAHIAEARGRSSSSAYSYKTSNYGYGSNFNSPPVHVQGYMKKNGTYVAPHWRTVPNDTKADNYSAPGNVNPWHSETALGDD